MADIIVDSEFRRKQKDGSYKIYHPVTKAKNVKTSDGKDVESQLAENAKVIGNINDTNLDSTLKGKSLTEIAKVLFQNADNAQRSIASVVGSPTIAGDTYSKIANDIQVLKNSLVTNLNDKQQSSQSTESLKALIDKVANISISKYADGSIKIHTLERPSEYNERTVKLNFSPYVIYVKKLVNGYVRGETIWYNSTEINIPHDGSNILITPGKTIKSIFENSITFNFSTEQYTDYNFNWWALGK